MDIARPELKRRKQRRRILATVAVFVVLAGVTFGLSRLEPAAPSVDRGSVIIDTVKRGEMLRQVRGTGTLVPEQLLFVQAESEGRVERVFVLPGVAVESETVLIELSNPELEQQAFDAEWQLKGAEANLARLKVQLQSDRLNQEAALAKLKSDLAQAALEAEADSALAKEGLVPEIIRKRSVSIADELAGRTKIEEKRLAIHADSERAQEAVAQAEIEKFRASLELKRKKVAALRVRAGVDGVLQQIGDREILQAGQRVTPGATLAKIVQPARLKAEIKIPETQAKDIELGQKAEIDTRNGVVPGHVVRIDPAPVQGTVAVDVKLDGPLPKGARPNLSVDGTIELERLREVLYVGRPISAQSEGAASVFKVAAGGREAGRVSVKFGRNSVNTIVVKEGLSEGDQIITSDMQQWDAHSRVRLN
jgi:HlyD family secretion protein